MIYVVVLSSMDKWIDSGCQFHLFYIYGANTQRVMSTKQINNREKAGTSQYR